MPAALVACTPAAYTPPARIAALDSATLPTTGGDAQVEAGTGAAMWGPSFGMFGGRVRYALNDQLAIEADTGMLHVTNDGSSGSRNGYTGRAGLAWHTTDHTRWQLAGSFGVGGGWSALAGTWSAFDLGVGIAGPRVAFVRPFINGSVSIDTPIQAPLFTVTDTSGTSTMLQFTNNQVVTVTVGVEVGPPEATVSFGASIVLAYAASDGEVPSDGPSDTPVFLVLGVGIRHAFGDDQRVDPTPLPAWVKSYIATPDQVQ